jgi:splicing factor 3B subunit 2
MHDVTAQDPKLLVSLKATRNTVTVPRHWCFKRKYLQGKRGIEKPPFDLPDFIKGTGIMEMRAALQEKVLKIYWILSKIPYWKYFCVL